MTRREKREQRAALTRAMMWALAGVASIVVLLMFAHGADSLSKTPRNALIEHGNAQTVAPTGEPVPPMAEEDSADTLAALAQCRADGLVCDYEHKSDGSGEVIGTPRSTAPVAAEIPPPAVVTSTTTVPAYEPVPTTDPNPSTDCTAHSEDPFTCG